MQFQFDGSTYRIAFHHPVPTGWVFHAGHEVELRRENHPRTGRPHGPAVLFCAECEARTGRMVRIGPVRKQESRSVECTVYVCGSVGWPEEKPKWVAIASGESKLNRKAKDQYTREGGRQAALAKALSTTISVEFRVAATMAYINRKTAVARKQHGKANA